ncbi:cysteine synthase family protein [Lachnospiraceae bacterium ZAX-1]
MCILDLIGNTPLIRLDKIASGVSGVTLLAKAEFYNLSGSVKDRAARAMLVDGIDKGLLTKDKTVLDATSGNTGIAYAMLGAVLDYSVILYIPQNTSIERKRMMRSFGAQIVETSPLEGSDGAFLAAQKEANAHPEKYFYPNQYSNPANPKAHYDTTGVEIWEQTNHTVTHFIASTGTSGTFMGTSRRLKDYNSEIQAIIVQPDSPLHGIEGTKHMASTIQPGIYNPDIADNIVTVSTSGAYEMARRLAREEGLFVGVSSGANVLAALTLAKTLPKGSVVVTILCDGGSRYMSDEFWDGGAGI